MADDRAIMTPTAGLGLRSLCTGVDSHAHVFRRGYRLAPVEIEFWKDGEFRLHDRVAFQRTADGWRGQRLYP